MFMNREESLTQNVSKIFFKWSILAWGCESWSWNQCTFGLSGSKSKCPSSFWKPQVLSFIPFSVALVKVKC